MAQPVIAYTKEVLDALEQAFTPQRLSPYKIRAKNNLEKALDLYLQRCFLCLLILLVTSLQQVLPNLSMVVALQNNIFYTR